MLWELIQLYRSLPRIGYHPSIKSPGSSMSAPEASSMPSRYLLAIFKGFCKYYLRMTVWGVE